MLWEDDWQATLGSWTGALQSEFGMETKVRRCKMITLDVVTPIQAGQFANCTVTGSNEQASLTPLTGGASRKWPTPTKATR